MVDGIGCRWLSQLGAVAAGELGEPPWVVAVPSAQLGARGRVLAARCGAPAGWAPGRTTWRCGEAVRGISGANGAARNHANLSGGHRCVRYPPRGGMVVGVSVDAVRS